jgi:ribosome recycling factor
MTYKYLVPEHIIKSLKDELTRIRTGRVVPSLVEPLRVEAYGSQMPMMQIASVSSPEARTIIITPYDKSLIRNICESIEQARLGVNPIDNGAGVILNFPPMTEENRKQQAKLVDEIEEKIKIQIRQQRQDSLTKIERELKAENASEDAIKSFKNDLQKEVDQLNAEIALMCKTKQEEVLKI